MIITLFFFLKENHLRYKTVGYHTFAFYFPSFFRVITTCTRYLVKATNHDIMYISHIIFWRIVTVWLYLYHLCWKSCHIFFCELHHFFLITMENRIKIFLEVLFFFNFTCHIILQEEIDGWLVYGVLCHYQQYFSYIMAVGFIGGGNGSTRKKSSQVTDKF